MDNGKPTTEKILTMMSANMGGKLPKSIELAGKIMPELVSEHASNNEFAMPKTDGAIDPETRTLIYLGIALATNSMACIEAMMNKAETQNISKEKILETLKIARFAEATRVVGNAEIVFNHLQAQN